MSITIIQIDEDQSVDIPQFSILWALSFLFASSNDFPKLHIMSSSEPVSLTSLRLEILQAILSFSCDGFTLRDAVLSTLSFYRAYSATPKLILRNVVRNELSEGVVPDAVAVVQAFRIWPECYHGPPWTTEPCSLMELVRLSRINRSVQYFADDFSLTLVANPITASWTRILLH